MENPQRKLHNPKSHAPAVYIPCWLIQVPSTLLSYAAKIVYGRLSQWSTTKCTVHRSLDQLSQEIGMNKRSLERILKELKEVGLIGTYQAEAGGINYYQFYDHSWMHEPINEHLIYHESYPQTQSAKVVPPRELAGTPHADLRVPPRKSAEPKIKKIEVNKNKSFCASAQKKPKSEWKKENSKRHEWADKKDITEKSTHQMANEAKHIKQNENFKRAAMPESLRSLVKNIKRANV